MRSAGAWGRLFAFFTSDERTHRGCFPATRGTYASLCADALNYDILALSQSVSICLPHGGQSSIDLVLMFLPDEVKAPVPVGEMGSRVLALLPKWESGPLSRSSSRKDSLSPASRFGIWGYPSCPAVAQRARHYFHSTYPQTKRLAG